MEQKKRPYMKPLAELTLLDRFLFACAMEDTGNLELVLQIILGKEIKLLESPQVEKELRTTLITIAPFDLFGKEKYRYTFRARCEEAEDVYMEDGAVRIFLNTHGTNPEEVGEELVELLQYFETTTEEIAKQCKSDRVKSLHRQIEKIKSAEEIGVKYMQEWEEKVYIKEEGRSEGAREKIKEQTAKKLARGKTAADIAEELEEELPFIEEIIRELEGTILETRQR